MKTLVRLGKIHEGLPAVAVKRVPDRPLQQWDEPLSWDDVIADPIAVVVGGYDEQLADLSDDVFVAGKQLRGRPLRARRPGGLTRPPAD